MDPGNQSAEGPTRGLLALDEKRHIIGLEVLDAGERLGVEAVESVAIEKVLSLKGSR